MSGSILKLIYLLGFIAGSVIRAVYTIRNKKNRIADDYETVSDKILLSISSMGLVIIPFLYLLTSWLNFADYHLPKWAGLSAGLLGAAIFVVALWVLWRSHADLGRNWLPVLQVREEHSLVTQGVFQYIRHPMYAAHWLWGIAQAWVLGD
jgi:protein-S-isoprenylcysteine O-methyltransferase Ste14